MDIKRYLLCLILSFISITTIFADGIDFQNLSLQKELSNYSVMALYQDERGLIWIGTRNGINIYDGMHVQTHLNSLSDSSSVVNNQILDIIGDKKGSVYVMARQGVSAYSINDDRYETITEEDVQSIKLYDDTLFIATDNNILTYNRKDKKLVPFYSLPVVSSTITDFQLKGDSLLIGTELEGLYVFRIEDKKLTHPIKDVRVSKIFIDSSECTWIATWNNGAYRISTEGIENYVHQENDQTSLCSNFVRTFCEDKFGNIWIGTFRGLNRFVKEDKSFLSYVPGSETKLTSSSVWSLLCDIQGNVWVGTYFGGLNYFNPKPEVKRYFQPNSINTPQTTVGSMIQDNNGFLWICTDGMGLCRMNEISGETKWFKHHPGKNSISHNNVKSIYFDEDAEVLWIGTHMGGLNKLDLKTEHFTNYYAKPTDVSVDKGNTICDIVPYKDSLILATHAGICLFDRKTERFNFMQDKTAEGESVEFSFDVELDSNGLLWISGDQKGLFTYDFRTKVLRKHSKENVSYKKANSGVNCTFEDSKKRLWICMNQTGIVVYDLKKGNFERFDVEKNNLLNNCVYGACEIAPDKLIFIMDNGFSYLDYQKKSVRNFMVEENLPLKALNQHAIYRANDGTIYIGGIDGMISFGSEFVEHRSDDYQIFPWKLYLNDQEVRVNDETGILDKSLSVTNKVTLQHKHSIFSVAYSITNYMSAYKDEIVYKLENFSDSWSVLKNENFITYTNLNPGTYKLIVKSNSKDKTNAPISVLEIEVLPPWYRTIWAYIFYVIVLFVVLRLIIHTYKNRLRLQTELEYERKHIEDIENLNRQKLQFFTNISHEFRTPLTLIIGEIELLMQVKSFMPSVYNRILNVYKSSMQLQSLISELLDFRKQEQGHMHIKVSEHNLVDFLRENYLLFKEYAISKNIDFSFERSSDEIMMYYDEKQFQKVINNLLSNAFKHTSENDKITLRVIEEEKRLIIQVEDSGKGMAKKDLERIFDRFYQTDDELTSTRMGVGIGLALTKGIVELHHGSISVDSELGKGTTFSVSLLKGKTHFTEDELNKNADLVYEKQQTHEQLIEVSEMEKQPELSTDTTKKFRILIVEDDLNLLQLLNEIFEPYYFTFTASDASKALDILKEEIPDIILTDIQMPGMSGLELCKKVKKNIDTCHIPVVLLTARTALEHKLEGFNTGADDYIMKPFDTNILLARCRNLINNRVVLQEKFTNQPQTTAQVFATNELDKEFMDRAMKIIEDNIENYEFSATTFAQEMAVARTKLFVKIKAITGETPNELIVTMRLKKAAYLLKNDFRLSVAEISDKVGFKSPRYFSRCFKERYKETPLNYRKGKTSSGDDEEFESDTDSTSDNEVK